MSQQTQRATAEKFKVQGDVTVVAIGVGATPMAGGRERVNGSAEVSLALSLSSSSTEQ